MRKKKEDVAHIAQETSSSEEDPVLLMMTTSFDKSDSLTWYLDSGCSNHMTCHEDWLCDLDKSRRRRVRFADGRTITAEGIGNMMVSRKNGKATLIEEVLFVPEMDCNLISLGQLLEKKFSIVM